MTGEGRPTRLITFTPGTVFGELALLDEETRSATVQADGFLVCYVLTREAFESLAADEPAIAIRLLANLGRELSVRLRRANRAICHLSL
jgi:CRP-like cAMP-binding protein